MRSLHLILLAGIGVLLNATASHAANVGVLGTKLIIVDKGENVLGLDRDGDVSVPVPTSEDESAGTPAMPRSGSWVKVAVERPALYEGTALARSTAAIIATVKVQPIIAQRESNPHSSRTKDKITP